MQIHVAHALCKQGCRLISYTVNIRLVTIAACYNCPRSPLCDYVKERIQTTLQYPWYTIGLTVVVMYEDRHNLGYFLRNIITLEHFNENR